MTLSLCTCSLRRREGAKERKEGGEVKGFGGKVRRKSIKREFENGGKHTIGMDSLDLKAVQKRGPGTSHISQYSTIQEYITLHGQTYVDTYT